MAAHGGGGSFGSGGGGIPPEAAYDGAAGPMVQCHTCGRSFNEASYPKHAKVCEKVFVQKRKAYNSTAARVAGTEAAKFVDVKKGAPKAGTVGAQVAAKAAGAPVPAGRGGGMPGNKLPKWKAQSEQAMMANRKIAEAKASGMDIRDIDFGPPQEDLDDRVPCPHCGRKFAALTAERHIPKCKDMIAKPNRLNAGGGRGAHMRR